MISDIYLIINYIMTSSSLNTDIMDLLGEALYKACEKKYNDLALKIINMNYYTLNYVNAKDNSTPLIIACKNKMSNVALNIIKNYHVNWNMDTVSNGSTALIYACENRMHEVVLEIVKNHYIC